MAEKIQYPVVREMLGRSETRTADGKSDAATRRFTVAFGSIPATVPAPTAVPGLPMPGTAHPSMPGLFLQSYRSDEGQKGEVIYTAEYARKTSEQSSSGGGGSGEPEHTQVETAREWGHGSVNRDLTADAVTGTAVLNANGEPFENVPSVAVETRTFRIVRKVESFPQTMFNASGTVNKTAVTIDGIGSVAPHCGLLKVTVNRIYDDETYKYESDMTVDVVSNKVRLDPTKPDITEIGHDVALLLSGFRYLKDPAQPGMSYRNTLITATDIDEKTGESKPAAAPVLLKPNGTIYEVPAGTENPAGYFKRVATHAESDWQTAWFN